MKNPVPGLRKVKFFLLVLILSLFLHGCGFFSFDRGGTGQSAAYTARKYIGVPYELGGQSPKGFDCSGLTAYVYQRHGVRLPRTSAKQAKVGRAVKKSRLRPGDLVFFSTAKKGRVSHVGIYVGDGKFIHAPGSGKKVTTASLNSAYYQKTYHSARRVAT
ncbi:MAG: C40 family peptidase [Candidatus Adiutrix sp.]|jgi:cell wall-associated NlpC family hydrolase|nr:C40 family peptidase [Candidatus Adiutrix sp.]